MDAWLDNAFRRWTCIHNTRTYIIVPDSFRFRILGPQPQAMLNIIFIHTLPSPSLYTLKIFLHTRTRPSFTIWEYIYIYAYKISAVTNRLHHFFTCGHVATDRLTHWSTWMRRKKKKKKSVFFVRRQIRRLVSLSNKHRYGF